MQPTIESILINWNWPTALISAAAVMLLNIIFDLILYVLRFYWWGFIISKAIPTIIIAIVYVIFRVIQ
jgi:hypothetical protein